MTRRILLLQALVLAVLLSCQTVPDSVPEDLSSAELFQRAQEYADDANYEAALLYLDAVDERFPDDRLIMITSQYHRALYLDQSGADEEAAAAFAAILSRYESETGLPAWIQTLSERRLAELQPAEES